MLFIASDHAGFGLKTAIVEDLSNRPDITVSDLGPEDGTSVDYPVYAHRLANAMRDHPESRGILVCGSGVGMSMAANRHPHIRCALASTPEVAMLSRQHNDANVLALGARMLERSTATNIVEVFLATQFEGGRHARRIMGITPSE